MRLADALGTEVTSWRDAHAALVLHNEPGDSTAGHLFEEFAKYFFLAAPEYKGEFKNVWAETEIPTRIRKKLTLAGRDYGVDLLLEDHEGRFHAVQCKFKTDQSKTLGWTKDRLSSWLAESDEAQGLIMFTNASGIDKQSTLKAGKKDFTLVTVGDLVSVSPETIESILRLAKGKAPKKTKRLKPYPHQRRAINDVVKGFKTHDRGQLILPCGAGKTLAALWLKERLDARRTLVLVPSLALLRQMRSEWATQQKARLPYLCVCSEKDIDKDKRDAIVTHAFEVPGHVTTQPDEIAEFASKHPELVVYSTYQSLQAVVDAGVKFDLAICDEAHKTATARHNEFALVHDDALEAEKRLYMTATPRVLSYQAKNALGEDAFAAIADMSDEETFGPEFHRMGFADAIEQDILVDYKIVVVGVSDREVKKHIENRTYLEDASADQVATSLALAKVMKKHGLGHGLTFHSTVNRAKSFAALHKKRTRKTEVEHVNGSMSTNDRLVLLDEFREAPHAVMTNARCLTEGVDVPAIDCVAFVDPKHSKVDIVQAAGRALRLPTGGNRKPCGVILIPIFYEVGQDPAEIASAGVFRNVFELVRAMADHDARLQAEITNLRLGQAKRGESGTRISIELDDEERLVLEGFEAKLKESLVEHVVTRMPMAVVPPGFFSAESAARALGCHHSTAHDHVRNGNLVPSFYVGNSPYFSEEALAACKARLGITVEPSADLVNIKELARLAGTTRRHASGMWKRGEIVSAGRGFAISGVTDLFHVSHAQVLRRYVEEPESNLLSAVELAARIGVTRTIVDKFTKSEELVPVREVFSPGGKGRIFSPRYSEEQVGQLRRLCGITLESTKGLLSYTEIVKMPGCNASARRQLKNLEIEPVGQAMTAAGLTDFYSRAQVRSLLEHRGKSAVPPGLLSAPELAAAVGQVTPKSVYAAMGEGALVPAYERPGSRGTVAYFRKEQVGELKRFLGITLDSTEGLVEEVELARMLGMNRATIGSRRRRGQLIPEGYALSASRKRVVAYYDPEKFQGSTAPPPGFVPVDHYKSTVRWWVSKGLIPAVRGPARRKGLETWFVDPKVVAEYEKRVEHQKQTAVRTPAAKLTSEQVLAIYRDPRPAREIAAEYRLTTQAVGNIKTGKSWAHVTRHKTGAAD